MPPRPNYVPLPCSWPYPALCPLPKPEAISPGVGALARLCVPYLGLCDLSGFCDHSQVWNPSFWTASPQFGL